MEAVVSILIPAIVENVFGALTEAVGLSDWLRQRLGRDPEKLAFHQALTQALTDSATHYPGRDLRYFAEILRDIGGGLLARTLQPAATLPTADELTTVWLNHLTVDSLIHYRAEFTQFATYFLDRLQFHLKNQQSLRWIAEARHERDSEEAMHRIADASEQSATNIEALGQEVTRLTAILATVVQTSSSSTVTTEGGAYIGGNVSGQNVAGRDLTINQYFVQGLARVATANYSERIENFLCTYLGRNDNRVPFGGRQQQLDDLNHWVDEPDAPPYYLMVAEAGRGKSALVSRWSAQLATRPELDVIFVPISIRFQTAAQDVFFAALAARLAQIHEAPSPEFFHRPTSAEEWKAICESYLRRPLPAGKRLVVILDGLDEAADWVAGPELFAVRPPPGLHLLVTARLRTRETDALGWAATLQWEGPHLARKVTLPALDQQGVADALNSMGNPLQWLAPRLDVVGKLYQLSQGDPLLVQLYVRELVKAQQHAGFLTPTDLETIEPGLDGFMQKWWDDQRNQWRMQKKDPHVEEKQVLPLLSACAVAVGPLLRSDLAALDGTHFGITRFVANQAELLGRWLIGDGVHQGYIFAHPRLREFFAGPTWLSADEYAAWQAKFCDWGRRVLSDLNRGNLMPKQAPEYLLRHYATHLTQSGATPRRFYALMSDGWRRAWEAVDVSYGGFLKDVDRAWAQARQAYHPQRPGRGEALAQQVRAALCRSSVATLSSNLPPELLAELVKRGLRTSTEALAMIKLMPKAEQRVLALTAVVPHLAVEVLDEALAVARASECKYDQHNHVSALCAIAIRFPEPEKTEILREALVATYTIQDYWSEGNSAIALHTLVPHLPPQLLTEVLAKLRETEYEKGRVREFSAFVKYISHQELKGMLEDIFDSYSMMFASHSRIPIARLFVDALPPALLEDAVEAANKQYFLPYRIQALNALMPYMSEEKRRQVIEKMFVFAFVKRELPHESNYVALATLAQWLSESEQKVLLEKAWIAWNPRLSEDGREILLRDPLVAGLCDRPTEAYAVIECALYLSPETCKIALAHYRQNTWENGNILRALASRLSTELVQETFIEACELKERVTIGALCPYLPRDLPIDLLEVALRRCRTIEDDHRVDVLIELVAYLPDNLRAKAVAAIHVINPKRYLDSLFLATYLPAAQFRAVVDVAIPNDDWALKELVARVPNLPDDELRIILRKRKALFDVSGPFARSINRSMLVVLSYWSTNEQRKMLEQAILDARTSSSHQLHRADPLIVLIPFLTGREKQEVIREAFAEIYGYSSISPIHMWACLSRLSALSPYLPPTMVHQVWDFIEGFESKQGQAIGLGVLARHFPTHQQNALLMEALNTLCKTDEGTDEFRLQHLEPHLTRWAVEQPDHAHAALAENLPILATKPRREFMYDLAALMPFILALAGDEAPQAAEGIYQAIQEVCGWWP